jgi:hypothetical protein
LIKKAIAAHADGEPGLAIALRIETFGHRGKRAIKSPSERKHKGLNATLSRKLIAGRHQGGLRADRGRFQICTRGLPSVMLCTT